MCGDYDSKNNITKGFKAILFDFDGVLTIDKTGSTTTTTYIAKKTGLPFEKIRSAYYRHNKALLLGKLTHEEIWSEFCFDVGENIDYQILKESFLATKLDEQMLQLIKELSPKYKIGLITDNKSDRMECILNQHALNNWFDVVAVSAKLHCGKDTADIFQYVLDELKLSAAECVFIDNAEKNLVVPKEMGMKAILFDDENRNVSQFRKTLENILDHGMIKEKVNEA